MMEWLNDHFAGILHRLGLPGSAARFNHAIFTRYDSQRDYIGFHADKEQDFEEGLLGRSTTHDLMLFVS